jgi:hypothetical protein
MQSLKRKQTSWLKMAWTNSWKNTDWSATRDRPAQAPQPQQFREERGISRSCWDIWRRKGLLPTLFQPAGPKGRVTILPEAESAWERRFAASEAAE